MSRSKVLIMLPTLNEAGHIELLIKQTLALPLPPFEVLVLDDDSSDGSVEIVTQLAAQAPSLKLIRRKPPFGRSHAIRDGFLYGLESGADQFVEMDADGSHQPRQIPSLLDVLDRADMVIGSRLVLGGTDSDRTWLRRLTTYVVAVQARWLLRLPVKDVNSGFRCYTRTAVMKIQPATLESKEPSLVYEILLRAVEQGLTVVEIPIEFAGRVAGNSKLNLSRLLNGYRWLLELAWKSIRSHRSKLGAK